MAQEDDLRALGKIFDLFRAISVILLIAHFYWVAHSLISPIFSLHEYVDQAFLAFNAKVNILEKNMTTKCMVFLFLILSCIGTKAEKKDTIAKSKITLVFVIGGVLFFSLNFLLKEKAYLLYVVLTSIGFLAMLTAMIWIARIISVNLMKDVFNEENESFKQERKLMNNENSVNLPTLFYYNKKWNKGWINVVNPYRATIVLGTPGSGKSFAVINSYIKQQIEKGFTMYIYDFKFPTLAEIAYNHYGLYPNGYKGKKPQFFILNFDDPAVSHRCNPLAAEFLEDIADAYEASYTIMLNLNRTWIQKQGDFFVESPIILLAAIIWFLKLYDDGKYCTFPHAMEILNQDYRDLFPVLMTYPELSNYLSPFMDAWQGGAQDQLQGQLASTKIAISRIVSPALYWVMTGDDFSLDINNPEDPKIVVIGNNPDRQNIYGAALGLYNSRIVKLINKPNIKSSIDFDDVGDPITKKTLKSSVIIDELPTIYFRGLDNLIATARSNRVAVCLGFQDFSQLNRDYGDKESKVIQNTVGNIFSGQVVGDTAKWISERCGKVLQKRTSVSHSNSGTSTTTSTQMDTLIPASKISNLTQGVFVGAVADEFETPISQKIFNAKIQVDMNKLKADTKKYQKIKKTLPYNKDEINWMMKENYNRIKEEAAAIIALEKYRLMNDPEFSNLFKQ